MFARFWVLVWLSVFSSLRADTLRVVGEEEGLIPYYYGPGLSHGLLVEVLEDFTRDTGIDARFHVTTTPRFQWDLEQGRANAMFGHPAWFPMSERLHLIGPLFHWRDRLFAQPDLDPQSLNTLQGTICLRKHFTYSESLEFRLGDQLIRYDARTADQLVRMFLRGRCEYAIMDDLEFRFLVRQGDVDPDLYETSIIEAEWPVYLGILKNQPGLIEAAKAYFAPDRFEFGRRWRALPPPP